MHPPVRLPFLFLLALLFTSIHVYAEDIYRRGGTVVTPELTAIAGWFRSEHDYSGRLAQVAWEEGFIKYGLRGTSVRAGSDTVHGGFALVSSATWGDGDAGGYSNGRERRTSIEEAHLGWKSGDLLPAFGHDGIDLSAGRQIVKVGRGFLIYDDGFNPGAALASGTLDRGGAFYIAPRHAFGKSAVVRLGGDNGWHGSVIWLKSNNHAQANTELAVGTVSHTVAAGTIGATYMRGLNVDERYVDPVQLQRRGMRIYSVLANGNAGIAHTNFGFEYAVQETGVKRQSAWYVQAERSFPAATWQPILEYRFSRYSPAWDILFTGGYRDWLQGEVASNYTGAYASNLQIHKVGLMLQPHQTLSMGLALFDLKTLDDRATLSRSAREANLYADYALSTKLMIAPLLGLYQPRRQHGNAGSASTNVYAQIMLIAVH